MADKKPEEKPTGKPVEDKPVEAPAGKPEPDVKPEPDGKPVEAEAPKEEPKPQPDPEPDVKTVEAPKPEPAKAAVKDAKEELREARLENARLNALLEHPQLRREDIDQLCSATTPEGVRQWADRFAARLGTQAGAIAGQAALSRAAAHQGGVATPASDEYSPTNLYELAARNARPRNNK